MEKIKLDLNHFPILDWQLAIKMAGGNEELAKDILQGLIKTLPEELQAIKQFYQKQARQQLLACIHKLHGALCYGGLPRLKTLAALLETQLKSNNSFNEEQLIEQLEEEAALFLTHVKHKSK